MSWWHRTARCDYSAIYCSAIELLQLRCSQLTNHLPTSHTGLHSVARKLQVIWAKLVRRATTLAVPVRRLYWSISSHFVAIHPWSVHRGRKSQKHTKIPYFGGSKSFKVIEVNTLKKARHRCLLWQAAWLCLFAAVFTLDEPISEKWPLLEAYLSLTITCAGLLEVEGWAHGLLKSVSDAENFICRLSRSISNHLGAIHFYNVSQGEIAKNSLITLFWGFKVVQGHRYWYALKLCHKCSLW